jgi:hypothetical protein
MEEKGVTKTIAVRLQTGGAMPDDEDAGETDSETGAGSLIDTSDYHDEEVPPEEGRQLPQGIDDPQSVSESDLHPLRAHANNN